MTANLDQLCREAAKQASITALQHASNALLACYAPVGAGTHNDGVDACLRLLRDLQAEIAKIDPTLPLLAGYSYGRKERVALGLCPTCGGKPEAGYRCCRVCINKARARQEAKKSQPNEHMRFHQRIES